MMIRQNYNDLCMEERHFSLPCFRNFFADGESSLARA